MASGNPLLRAGGRMMSAANDESSRTPRAQCALANTTHRITHVRSNCDTAAATYCLHALLTFKAYMDRVFRRGVQLSRYPNTPPWWCSMAATHAGSFSLCAARRRTLSASCAGLACTKYRPRSAL